MVDDGITKIIPTDDHHVIFKVRAVETEFLTFIYCIHIICDLTYYKTIHTKTRQHYQETYRSARMGHRYYITITYGRNGSYHIPQRILPALHPGARHIRLNRM